jgi:hypothetical protein
VHTGLIVQPDGVRPLESNIRTLSVVDVVPDRDDGVEPIIAAAKLDNDQYAIRVCSLEGPEHGGLVHRLHTLPAKRDRRCSGGHTHLHEKIAARPLAMVDVMGRAIF